MASTLGSAEDMAELLHHACRDAAGYARDERERAGTVGDTEHEVFWRDVTELLADPGAFPPTHPAPRRPLAHRALRPVRPAGLPRGAVRLARC